MARNTRYNAVRIKQENNRLTWVALKEQMKKQGFENVDTEKIGSNNATLFDVFVG